MKAAKSIRGTWLYQNRCSKLTPLPVRQVFPSATLHNMSRVTIKSLEPRHADASTAGSHHVGSPPSSFINPWPSYQGITPLTAFKTRFGHSEEKDFVPVPEGPNGQRSDELVKILKPDWGAERRDCLRATWIGHASFLVETPAVEGAERGIRILFDPVFSERTSPLTWLGPKRYTPTPCNVDELPEVDTVCISHNHYDHLDYHTVSALYKRHGKNIHFFVGLNDKAWFTKHICPSHNVTEMDWWDHRELTVEGVGSVKLTCTPSQHGSARTPFDKDNALWCSWALETETKKLYFAGDTAYQAVGTPSPCPVFVEISEALGPFDLALLPIGLFKPPHMMASVHCSPEQSLEIHKAIRAKLSIGMHYGTVRGGISGQYEDVREPPRRWREAAEKEGVWLGGGVEGKGSVVDTSREGVGLCHVGETVAV